MQKLEIKSFLQYSELAAVTNDTNDKTHLENNAHYIYGMLTEFQEFKYATDIINRDEEIGDIFWYLSQYFKDNNLTHLVDVVGYYWNSNSRIIDEPMNPNASRIFGALVEIVDIEKKCLAYGKERDISNIETYFKEIIESLYYSTNKTFKQICEANISKLRVRYGEKFDAHLALNRNLVIERSDLEEKLGS